MLHHIVILIASLASCGSLWAGSPLNVHIVAPGRETHPCGGADFAARYSIATTDSGFIIQHVIRGSVPVDCDGFDVPPQNVYSEYWTTWRVVDGEVYQGFDDIPHYAQLFRSVPEASPTSGFLLILAATSFVKNYSTHRSDWEFNTIPEAGSLPTRVTTKDGNGRMAEKRRS